MNLSSRRLFVCLHTHPPLSEKSGEILLMEKVRSDCAGANLANSQCHAAAASWTVSDLTIIRPWHPEKKKNHQRINASSLNQTKYHSPRNPSLYNQPPTRCINEAFFFRNFKLSHFHLWLLRNAAAASIPPRALPSPSFLRMRRATRNKVGPVPVAWGVRSQMPVVGRTSHHPQVTVHPRPRPRPHSPQYSPCLRDRLPATAFP